MLSAPLDSVSDGILAVDHDGRVRTYNRQYLDLWRMPESIVRNHDSEAILDHILGLVADPEATLAQATAMREHAEGVYEDSIELIDGRVIEPGDVFGFNALVGPRTVELGAYYGCLDGERLRAMAAESGQRLPDDPPAIARCIVTEHTVWSMTA